MQNCRRLARQTSIVVCMAIAGLLAACAQKPVSPDSAQLTSNGRGVPAKPGSKRDFAQNVGDIVYFTTDSTDLTPEEAHTTQS